MVNAIGTEIVSVIAVSATGGPSAIPEYLTTQQIANLALNSSAGTTITLNGTYQWDSTITVLWIKQSSPTLPAQINIRVSDLVPYKVYLVLDASGNAFTYPITLTASSGEIKLIQQNYDAVQFTTDGTNVRYS